MRLIFSAVFALCALGASARAEHGVKEKESGMRERPEPTMGFPDRLLERLDEKLELTAEQKKTVKAVIDEAQPSLKRHAEELKALREKMKESLKGMKAEMRQAKEKIREILTYEQREEFDEVMARLGSAGRERRPGMKDGMGERRGPGDGPEDEEPR